MAYPPRKPGGPSGGSGRGGPRPPGGPAAPPRAPSGGRPGNEPGPRPNPGGQRPRNHAGPRPATPRPATPRPAGPRPADARPAEARSDDRAKRPQLARPAEARSPEPRAPERSPDRTPGRSPSLRGPVRLPDRDPDRASDRSPDRASGPRPGETPRGAVWLYGLHAVGAALGNPARRLRRLILTEEAETALAARRPPPWPLAPERSDRARIDQLLGREAVHQGAALLADVLGTPLLAAVLERPGAVLVLDQVSDPRNIGAVLRSAAAFGAACVITQDRNAPEETGALAKAASGALETVPLIRAVNLARTIVALKAAGLWTIGLDAGGAALSGPALAERRGGAGAGGRRAGDASPGARNLRRGRWARHARQHGKPQRVRCGDGGAVRAGAAQLSRLMAAARTDG